MTNEMPKLEAGKHIVEFENGQTAFFVGCDSLIYLEDMESATQGRIDGWDTLSGVDELIVKIYERKQPLLSLSLIAESKSNTLIWKRDDKAAKRQKEYDELQRQIAQLQKQADKLQEMDDE